MDFSAKAGCAKRLTHANNGVTGNGAYRELHVVISKKERKEKEKKEQMKERINEIMKKRKQGTIVITNDWRCNRVNLRQILSLYLIGVPNQVFIIKIWNQGSLK